MICMVCKNPTSASVLSTLGRRCSRCYEVYCKAPPPAKTYPEHLPDGMLAWAHRLKWRHEQGESLSAIQIEKYKKALRIT